MNLSPLKSLKKAAFTVVTSALIITPALAHDIYIWPSYFTTNTDKATHVSVDVTASHSPFRPDFAMDSSGVKVLGVDGKQLRRFGPYYQGQRRSSFDLPVQEAGTYGLIYQREASYFTKYLIGKRDTEKHMRANKVEAAKQLPKDARDVETRSYSTVAMSFVTNKAPTSEVLTPKNKGFELIPVTHPADYVTEEKLEIKALFNGEPVADQSITIEREGSQYREDSESLEITTNKAGIAHFTLENGGRYILKSNHEKKSDGELADIDVTRIFYAFEVIFE